MTHQNTEIPPDQDGWRNLAEVFRTFLKLGLTSFGGPIAHLGYFRDELVIRRKWLDEFSYADLVALCQFLPGPASRLAEREYFLRRINGIAAPIVLRAHDPELPSSLDSKVHY